MQEFHDSYSLDTRPNSFSYNSVINCWASLSQNKKFIKNGQSKAFARRAEDILRGMQGLSKAEQPTVVTYNTVIKAYRDDFSKAETLLQEMIANDLQPNEKTMETLLYVLKHDVQVKDKEERAAEIRKQYFPTHLNGSGQNFRSLQRNDSKGWRDHSIKKHRHKNACSSP
jgi:pentatricopeptide repeat protein